MFWLLLFPALLSMAACLMCQPSIVSCHRLHDGIVLPSIVTYIMCRSALHLDYSCMGLSLRQGRQHEWQYTSSCLTHICCAFRQVETGLTSRSVLVLHAHAKQEDLPSCLVKFQQLLPISVLNPVRPPHPPPPPPRHRASPARRAML